MHYMYNVMLTLKTQGAQLSLPDLCNFFKMTYRRTYTVLHIVITSLPIIAVGHTQ